MTTNPPPRDRRTVSIGKAVELVGVSRRTIYNWILQKKVDVIRTAGGSIRIFEDSLWREVQIKEGRWLA